MQERYWEQFVEQVKMLTVDPADYVEHGRTFGDEEETTVLRAAAQALYDLRKRKKDGSFLDWVRRNKIGEPSPLARYVYELMLDVVARLCANEQVSEKKEHELLGAVKQLNAWVSELKSALNTLIARVDIVESQIVSPDDE